MPKQRHTVKSKQQCTREIHTDGKLIKGTGQSLAFTIARTFFLIKRNVKRLKITYSVIFRFLCRYTNSYEHYLQKPAWSLSLISVYVYLLYITLEKVLTLSALAHMYSVLD